MIEHTADRRREEIARIAEAAKRVLYGTSIAPTDAVPDLALTLAPRLYDAGLRSQDTATVRIAEMEGAVDAAHRIIRRWEAGLGADVAMGYVRTVLSGETRTGGGRPRGRSLVCSIAEHAKCDGNAPNGPAGIGNPCACSCHPASPTTPAATEET